MKTMLVLGGFIGLVVLVTTVLSSATDSGDIEGDKTAVTGPLEVGSVSRAQHVVNVWRECRHTFGRKDRAELLVGQLHPGDVFVVQKHRMSSGDLWVKIVGLDGLDIEGWVESPAADPFRASKVEGRQSGS